MERMWTVDRDFGALMGLCTIADEFGHLKERTSRVLVFEADNGTDGAPDFSGAGLHESRSGDASAVYCDSFMYSAPCQE